MRYAPDISILEMRSGQGHNNSKMVWNTPPPRDASRHQIWYLKICRRYAPDTKLYVKTHKSSLKDICRLTDLYNPVDIGKFYCHLPGHTGSLSGSMDPVMD